MNASLPPGQSMAEEKAAYRWPMLVLLLVVSLFVTGMGMGVMPPLFDEIKEDTASHHTAQLPVGSNFKAEGEAVSHPGRGVAAAVARI